MNLEELKQTEWYKERPEIIKQAINILPPTQLYKFKDSGKQCQLISYSEPKSGKFEEITVVVQKTGKGGLLDAMGIGFLDTHQVFGVRLEDLEVWSED